MGVLIGTSGWQYRDWRGAFYPEGIGQGRWLEHYARHFQTVEVNNAFYRLPEASTFRGWASRTPADFVVVVKVSRYLTHIKRLKEPAEPVARFVDHARHLGPKLGPVLLQLPPNLRLDLEALDNTLSRFPKGWRVAVELRHESWFLEETFELLTERGASFCLADSPRRKTPARRTAGWGYVRFHEGRASPQPCYGEKALGSWARSLADLYGPEEEVYAFFNNDPKACAVRDARLFARAVSRHGLQPSRVPGPGDVALASASS